MAEKSYNVILEGAIIHERSRQEVVKRLSAVFNKETTYIEKLLSGKPRLIRQNIDLATAGKYRKIIEKAGAFCRIEPVEETEPSPEPELADPAHAVEPALPAVTCPRCGYVPSREDDVMLVRGDCPICGFMVRKEAAAETLQEPETEADEFLDTDDFATDLYSGRLAASLSRRALASIYTFSQFLTVYCMLVLVLIVSVVPLSSVPEHVGRSFLFTAYTAYPVLLGVLSVLIVSLLAPLFNEGRSWGQKAFAIEIMYTEEAQFGGLASSLAFRTAVICLLTFAPGLILRWMGYKTMAWNAWWVDTLVMILLALITWSVSWLLFLLSDSERSLLDVAGGTVQTETSLLPAHPVRKALMPLFTILIVLIGLGMVSLILGRLKW